MFYEITITLIPNPDKDIQRLGKERKLHTNISYEHIHKPNAEICKKENIINQVGFSPGMIVWLKINVIHHTYRLKEKNYGIISIDAENAFVSIQLFS